MSSTSLHPPRTVTGCEHPMAARSMFPPSAVRYTTRRHLEREVAIVEWATAPDTGEHRAVTVDEDLLVGLDDGQVAAVVAMLSDPRPVITWSALPVRARPPCSPRRSPPGSGQGSACSVSARQRPLHVNSKTVLGLWRTRCTSSSMNTASNRPPGRGSADELWDLPARSVVIIDESGMVDTRLLHEYAKIARAKQWRTVLVGDHRQLDAVDAGGMFAELVDDPDVMTVELDTLHRFQQDWEADASLELRDGDPTRSTSTTLTDESTAISITPQQSTRWPTPHMRVWSRDETCW